MSGLRRISWTVSGNPLLSAVWNLQIVIVYVHFWYVVQVWNKYRGSRFMSRNWLGFQFLGFHEKNRDNNFTILRLALAWLVLFGHSFPLTGTGFDPLSKLIMPYTWIGGIAVGGFFAISGYLVSASITQRSMPESTQTLSCYIRLFLSCCFDNWTYCNKSAFITIFRCWPLAKPVECDSLGLDL